MSLCSSVLLVDPRHGHSATALGENPQQHSTAVRRYRPDGTIHSICLRCLATIASASTDGALTAREAAHICNPRELALAELSSTQPLAS